jgi:hypothetical protein
MPTGFIIPEQRRQFPALQFCEALENLHHEKE